MLAMFVFSIIVQYNDPDPLTWMGVYGAAAILTIAFISNRLHWALPAILFIFTLIWASTIEPEVWGYVTVPDLFSAWEMKNIVIEEGREMGGLLIVSVWSLFIAIISFRHRKQKEPSNQESSLKNEES